ncbi:MAG: carbohydrate ABC transporter permease [Ruthenibacterium sp.]
MKKSALRLHSIVLNLTLLFLALLMLYPMIFMVFTSFKSNPEFFQNFWGAPTAFHLENYTLAFSYLDYSFWNTILICLVSVPGTLITGSLSAYAFARLHFPCKKFLYMLVLALMMIPNMLVLIPSFTVVAKMGILNTHWVVSLPAIANGQAFVIFVLRGFFSNLPEEVFESARIDGAGEIRIYGQMVLPLSLPIMGTMFIMRLLTDWNDYLWPSITISEPTKWPIAVAIKAFRGAFDLLPQWGPLYAGFTLTVIPLLVFFAFTMRYYVEGITSGAIKG